MRFLTALLLLLSTLAHAGDGDFLKATINGKPYDLPADVLVIHHEAGGTDFAKHQSYTLTTGDPFAPSHLELTFYMPVGGTLKAGTGIVPDPLEFFTAKPPFVQLQVMEGSGADINSWSLTDGKEGAVVITSIKGKVVEGTFRGKLRSYDDTIREVTNGTFRFTME